MKNLVWASIASMILAAPVCAEEDQTGFINVNVGDSPTGYTPPQPVTLFGCNNTTFKSSVNWGVQNQVVGDIPYGHAVSESGKKYFISKYYLASPPAYRGPDNKQYPFIGLVTPDRFTFQGERPAQMVDLDYRILRPTYLKEVPVDFNFKYDKKKTCNEQNVTAIPINTVCKNFPWNIGALGASGIGQLTNDGGMAFLPFLGENSDPLLCDVTLLDDVILGHEVYFHSAEGLTKTINLTALQGASQKGANIMNLVCVPRQPHDIPAGCAAP
jgi:hypothetical protein